MDPARINRASTKQACCIPTRERITVARRRMVHLLYPGTGAFSAPIVAAVGAALVGCATQGSPMDSAAPRCREHHTVVAGETLVGVARRYEASVGEIAWANAIADEDLIFVGQSLCVPARGLAPVGELVAVSHWGCREYHRVTKGDTLEQVASAYSTTVSAIVEANPVRLVQGRENILIAGWGLCVP